MKKEEQVLNKRPPKNSDKEFPSTNPQYQVPDNLKMRDPRNDRSSSQKDSTNSRDFQNNYNQGMQNQPYGGHNFAYPYPYPQYFPQPPMQLPNNTVGPNNQMNHQFYPGNVHFNPNNSSGPQMPAYYGKVWSPYLMGSNMPPAEN
jgi:hypothetical protein